MTDDNQESQSNDDNQSTATGLNLTEDDIKNLLKQNTHGQDFIETLKQEKQELQAKYDQLQQESSTRESVEELLAKMRDTNYEANTDGSTTPQLDKNELLVELKQQVFSELTEQQQSDALKKNFERATSTLREKHGEKYEDYMAQRDEELDLSREKMAEMAATTPKAFLKLMDTQGTQQAAPTTPSSRTVEAPMGQTEQSEFEKIANLQKNINTPEGRAARELWNDREWQRKQRERILEEARTKGSQYGNIIR